MTFEELTKAVVEHQKKMALDLIDYVYENDIKVVTVIAGNKTAVFRVMDLSNAGMDLYSKLASAERTKKHLLWAIDRANSEEDLARQAEAFERSRAEAAEHKIATALEWLDSGLTGEALAYHVAEALRAK